MKPKDVRDDVVAQLEAWPEEYKAFDWVHDRQVCGASTVFLLASIADSLEGIADSLEDIAHSLRNA